MKNLIKNLKEKRFNKQLEKAFGLEKGSLKGIVKEYEERQTKTLNEQMNEYEYELKKIRLITE